MWPIVTAIAALLPNGSFFDAKKSGDFSITKQTKIS